MSRGAASPCTIGVDYTEVSAHSERKDQSLTGVRRAQLLQLAWWCSCVCLNAMAASGLKSFKMKFKSRLTRRDQGRRHSAYL